MPQGVFRMALGELYALCGDEGYVVLGLKSPVIIGFFAFPTPHNISHLRLGGGVLFPRLARHA